MLREMGFTEARAKLSDVFDQVVHQLQPVVVKRGKSDQAMLVSRAFQKLVLGNQLLTVELLKEDDGSVTAAVDDLELVVNAPTRAEAEEELVHDLKYYAQDYFERFQQFINAPNRKGHLPYLLKVMLADSDDEIRAMLRFSDAAEV